MHSFFHLWTGSRRRLCLWAWAVLTTVLTACGGGGSSGGDDGGGSSSWGNTPLKDRQAHLASYNATLVHRVHPMEPGWTPNHWPYERFIDVWHRNGAVVARFEYLLGPQDRDPGQWFVTLQGSESAATRLFTPTPANAIFLPPVQTILGSAYDNVRAIYQDEVYWDEAGQPHGLWSYQADFQGDTPVSDVSNPGGPVGKGELLPGFKTGGSGRIWPLKGKFYIFGCRVWGVRAPPDYPIESSNGETRSDVWTTVPDMSWPREATPTFIQTELGALVYGAGSGTLLSPASCTESMDDGSRLLLAYAYATEPSMPGSSYRGAIALVGFDGSGYSLLGQSDALPNSVWSSTHGNPALIIRHDSTDPTRPYVLAVYEHEQRVPSYSFVTEVRVFQLDGGQLRHRFTAPITTDPSKRLSGHPRSIVMHKGRLIVEHIGSKGYEFLSATASEPVAVWKPGLLIDQFDYLTFMKSEAGKLYLGVQRAEFAPYRHDLAELIRVDD